MTEVVEIHALPARTSRGGAAASLAVAKFKSLKTESLEDWVFCVTDISERW